MPQYTVQCGYYDHRAITLLVEAANPEAACQAAIELANGSADWRTTCHVSESFIDALAEGDLECPWTSCRQLPVPDRYSEAGVMGWPQPPATGSLEHRAKAGMTISFEARALDDFSIEIIDTRIGDAVGRVVSYELDDGVESLEETQRRARQLCRMLNRIIRREDGRTTLRPTIDTASRTS